MKDLYVIDKEWLDKEIKDAETEVQLSNNSLIKTFWESRKVSFEIVRDHIKPYLDHVKQVCSYDTITHTHPETLGNDTGSPKEG